MRAPTPADAAAVAALVIRGDVAELGEADYTLEDLLQEWDESSFDLARDAVVIETRGAIAGYAAFRHNAKTVVTADDEDLAPALIDWCEEQGRARGHDAVRAGRRRAQHPAPRAAARPRLPAGPQLLADGPRAG